MTIRPRLEAGVLSPKGSSAAGQESRSCQFCNVIGSPESVQVRRQNSRVKTFDRASLLVLDPDLSRLPAATAGRRARFRCSCLRGNFRERGYFAEIEGLLGGRGRK